MDSKQSDELNIKEISGNDHVKYVHPYNEYNDPFVQELLANPSSLDIEKIVKLIEMTLTPDNIISGRISNITKTGDGLSFNISSPLSFPLIQTFNISESDLVNALKNTKYSYNEESKLIYLKFGRKTVILLNAPGDITADEIKQFFGDLSSEIIETKIDIDTWFITFKTEDNAIDAVIKCSGKKLKDNKVNVRIKSESVLKNFQSDEQPSFVTDSYYLSPDQWYFDGQQYYNSYQGEFYPYEYSKPSYRHNQNSRFRGKGGRKYGSPRHDSKDTTNIPLQIMGNGEIVYGKKPSFNKGQGSHYRGKTHSLKRGEKRSFHQAPPLGVSHFPPLGSTSKNIRKISRDEILSLHDKALDVSNEIKESPVVSKELNNELASTVNVEGNLKNDILDAKWWDTNQKRSKSTQRRRPKSNASEIKPQLNQDPNLASRSTSVGKRRKGSTSVQKSEELPVVNTKEEGQIETPATIEKVDDNEKTEEVRDTTVPVNETSSSSKPKWADIARTKNQ